MVLVSKLSEQNSYSWMCVRCSSQFHCICSWPSLWGELCCFLFSWHWLKLSGSLVWACWAACANPGGSACPWRTLQVSLLISRCSWWPIPQVPLDSSTVVRSIMGWTGTDERGGERVTRNSPKQSFRGLYYQWKGKGLEGLWQFVGQNLSRETQQIVFASGTAFCNSDDYENKVHII